MNKKAPSGINFSLSFFTKKSCDVIAVQKTLLHVYPNVSVEEIKNEAELSEKNPSFIIVDTSSLSQSLLDHILEKYSALPVILVVKDFAEVRNFSSVLTGRRSIVTHADIEGMGIIQAVHHLLERQQLHEQLQKTSHHLRELSIRDELTKLFNHRYLDELLTTEVKKANRYKRPLALIIFAIKNFTAINEALGHSEGDRILAKAADIIRSSVREVDVPARYGDNEFAVILPESDEAAASVVAKRIQEAIPSVCAGLELQLKTCCGIGTLSEKIQTRDELIHAALGALIEAKKNGEDAICTSVEINAKRHEVHENRHIIGELHNRFARLTQEAERNYFQSIIKIVADIPILKKILLPHSERVAFFAQRLAENMGLDEEEARSIYRLGLLHDTGKLAIDPEILNKPSKLSTPELELIKQHPLFAVQILDSASFLDLELPAILHHHERYDGLGYPEGLSGDNIPIKARILAIAEAWDTMITPQPYRLEPLPLDLALRELKNGAGKQFDEELVDKFTELISG